MKKINNPNSNVQSFIEKEYPYVVYAYIDDDYQGYCAYLIDIPEVVAYDDTVEEVVQQLEDARIEWIHYAINKGIEIPGPSQPKTADELSGRVTLRLPKSLHKRLIDCANIEGVSLNTLIVSSIQTGLHNQDLKAICSDVRDALSDIRRTVTFPISVTKEVNYMATPNDLRFASLLPQLSNPQKVRIYD